MPLFGCVQVVMPPRPAGYDLFVFGTNPFGALGLGEDETEKGRPTQVGFLAVMHCYLEVLYVLGL